MLSYADIRQFVCEKLDAYYQTKQANHLADIHDLITLLFTPDPRAVVNYNYDQGANALLKHVRLDINGRHSGMLEF